MGIIWTPERLRDLCTVIGECWEYPGPRYRANGAPDYGTTSFKNRRIRAHRLSWVLHNGPIPAGLCVCHRCDNHRCVNPAHLFLGTQRDNMNDMVAKGRHGRGAARGEAARSARLTATAVREIRTLRALSAGSVALAYSVSEAAVRDIWSGRTWKHVT